jgi:LmbE family N-acetylglucosaminyl deacetylase
VATVVFVHAHPDDEAILTGGTMAKMSDEGHRVVLVTATRGELGELPAGGLEPGETLTQRRVEELARAGAVLGVARQVYLDYLDSGMAGEPTNDRAGSFASADVGEAAARLAAVLEEEGADVLVTYDEHGGYGHPDHVQVHRVSMAAAELAGTPVVYLATMNRDFVASLAERLEESDWSPPEGSSDGLETMGEPASRLTTDVDVTGWIDRKRESMRVHASQITEDSFFLAMPDDVFAVVWGHEWYIRVRPPVEPGATGPTEQALLVPAAAAADSP